MAAPSALQRIRGVLATLLEKRPDDLKASEEAKMLRSVADHKVYNIVHLIYPLEALRRPLEGLLVLASHDGGSLARWIPRRGAYAAAS
jgi:hypothetical protein